MLHCFFPIPGVSPLYTENDLFPQSIPDQSSADWKWGSALNSVKCVPESRNLISCKCWIVSQLTRDLVGSWIYLGALPWGCTLGLDQMPFSMCVLVTRNPIPTWPWGCRTVPRTLSLMEIHCRYWDWSVTKHDSYSPVRWSQIGLISLELSGPCLGCCDFPFSPLWWA